MNLCDNDLPILLLQPCEFSLGCFLAIGRGELILDGYCLLVSSYRLFFDTLSYPFLIDESVECLYKLLVLLVPLQPLSLFHWNSNHQCYYLPVLRSTDLRLRRGMLLHMQATGLKSDGVSLGIPPAWPDRKSVV